MKIRNKLLITVTLFILLGGVFVSMLFRANQLSQISSEIDLLLNQIESGSYQLSLLTYEIVLHHQDARPQQQWLEKHARLVDQINNQELSEYIDTSTVIKLNDDLATLDQLFKRLIPAQEHKSIETSSANAALLHQRQLRIAASILTAAQSMAGYASELRKSVYKKHSVEMQAVYNWAFIITVVTTLLLVMLSYGVFRNIFNSIQLLLEGTQRVRKGDLSFRTDLRTNDEIEEYANAFNQMVSRLSETMASRDLLNKEITDHKLTEEQLRNYKNELEEKVKERTDALEKSRMAAISIMEDFNFQRKAADNARKHAETINQDLENEIAHRKVVEKRLLENEANLKQAVIAADSANQAKSAFLANMSHELRTPLNAILGFSEIMSKDPMLSAEQQEKIGVINRSGEHLLEMINDVLDLSKIESGRMELEETTFDLPRMLADIADMIKIRAEAKNLKFELQSMPGLSQYVHTDVGKLRQILINLLGNAIKFTQQGGVSLKAETYPGEDEDGKLLLHFEVEDSGIGIPEDKLNDIFIPFIQAGRSDRPKEGSGLGLAISKSLVDLLDGDLTVKSVLDKGSVFTFKIPALISNESELEFDLQKARPAVLGLAEDQPEWRILVVDDNKENLQLLKTLLSQVGFHIREAYDGQQAIDEFKRWNPHFIWMDMRMPNVDGYEATRIIRTLPGGQDVKIVAITASAFKENTKNILEAGCDNVVRKPYRSYEIFDALEKELGVSFSYDTNDQAENADIQHFTAEWAEKLPKDILEDLLANAKELNANGILSIINNEKYFTQGVQEDIESLMRGFRFDKIIELVSQTETESKT